MGAGTAGNAISAASGRGARSTVAMLRISSQVFADACSAALPRRFVMAITDTINHSAKNAYLQG